MSEQSKSVRLTEVVTGEVRLAFPQLWKPKAFEPGKREEYSAVLLFPPSYDLAPIRAAMLHAVRAEWGSQAVTLADRGNPLRACNGQWEGFDSGWHFLRCKSGYAPRVYDQRVQPIEMDFEGKRIFAGCWVRANIDAFTWQHPTGGKGVGFNLIQLQLLREDKRLGGGRAAADVFTPIDMPDAASGNQVSPDNDEALRKLFGG